jgi:hypothetical protein
MPWTPKDASTKTKKASTPSLAERWAAIANNIREKGGSDASAIRQANGVIKKASRKK